mgnify:CR=1 FL=1
MISHKVKVYPSKIHLPKKNQLAWKIAEIASDNIKLDKAAIEMVINRIIDNASVAIASLNRKPVHGILWSRGYAWTDKWLFSNRISFNNFQNP